MSLSDRERAIRQRLKDDFEHYAAKCLKIRMKSGQIRPFILNRAQQHIHERIEDQRRRTGKVRAIIVKGRQQGASTYIGGRFYWRCSHQRGCRVYILTHEQTATDNLFGMVERYHENCPTLVKPATGASNAKELSFPLLDSGYQVATAGTKATGRSNTIQKYHGSEVAFWPNAADHFAGSIQAVPDEPDTEIILESTGNGLSGEFYERSMDAMRGLGDYELIFVPWFWEDGYRRPAPEGFALDEEEAEYADLHGCDLEQMAWRRAKLVELRDPMKFKQEYPATVLEAFQAVGHDSFIKPDLLDRARKAKLEGIGPLIIGVDPKREGKDRFSIAWRRGRQVSKVESDDAAITNTRAASKLKDIIDRDKPARVFIDAGGGAGIYDILVGWGEKYRKICRLVSFGSAPIHPPRQDKDGKELAGDENRRVEMWRLSREWLEDEGGADIPDRDSLQADACAPGYGYHPTSSKLQLESKREMKRRNVRSTDEWDSVVLTFAEPVGDEPDDDMDEHEDMGEHGWMA
jgi:hypothetical protein